MRLGALLLDEPTPAFGGVLTRNAFCGAPIILAREVLQSPLSRGVLVNTRVANVGSPTALEDAQKVQAAFARAVSCRPSEAFVLSTGVIGWSLPVTAMVDWMSALDWNARDGDLLDLARSIMTTDAYPKLRSIPLGEGRLCGVVKGAGMIEPHLATMIGLILTDVTVERETLRDSLRRAAEVSFNAISVDSDQSTSDAILAFSSRHRPSVSAQEWEEALTRLCLHLAEDVVRNGEGTAHVLDVHVRQAPSRTIAATVARRIANSPLVKTAIYGNDPNVGRILAAAGSALGETGLAVDPQRWELRVGHWTVFMKGAFRLTPQLEEDLHRYLRDCAMPETKEFPPHERNVVIELFLGLGQEQARVWGSDLSPEYVRVNADYRS